jgi:hypothetical protein
LDPALSQFYPVYALASYYLKLHFNIILPASCRDGSIGESPGAFRKAERNRYVSESSGLDDKGIDNLIMVGGR